MMTWKAYRLVYRAMSPVHIGWHTLGYIKLTRHYIPGKSMWGAMTANLTRTYGIRGVNDYAVFGDLLKTDILASYFFPAIDADNPLLPHYTDLGIIYGATCRGKYAKEEFERLFIGSFGQTAIMPQSNTAEDESLHESEYISPGIKENGEYKPVLFVGYLFIKEGASLNGKKIGWDEGEILLYPAIREIFIGGDIKYGWGQLKLLNSPGEEGSQSKIFGCEFQTNGLLPRFDILADSPLPGHLAIDFDSAVKGDIEPLVGREWSTDKNGKKKFGAGQKISQANVCWTPGSVLVETKTLEIGKYGILSCKGT